MRLVLSGCVDCERPDFRLRDLARALLGIARKIAAEAAILELTQNAVTALKRVIAEADSEICGIRIAALGGGCAGYQYEMGLEVTAREGDAVIHFGDVMVFVDAESKTALTGVEVDFCETPAAQGFVFHQPNTCGSCGKRQNCGS